MNKKKVSSKLKLNIKSLNVIPEADQNKVVGGALDATTIALCNNTQVDNCSTGTDTKTESSGCLLCYP